MSLRTSKRSITHIDCTDLKLKGLSTNKDLKKAPLARIAWPDSKGPNKALSLLNDTCHARAACGPRCIDRIGPKGISPFYTVELVQIMFL